MDGHVIRVRAGVIYDMWARQAPEKVGPWPINYDHVTRDLRGSRYSWGWSHWFDVCVGFELENFLGANLCVFSGQTMDHILSPLLNLLNKERNIFTNMCAVSTT